MTVGNDFKPNKAKPMSVTLGWSDAYNIDGGFIDAQHKQLLHMAGRLMEFDEELRQKEEIKELVLQLYKYMEDHFRKEEEFAKSIGYPKMDELAKSHEEIIDTVNGAMKSCTDYRKLCGELRKILFFWVANHILTVDKDIGRYLEETKTAEDTAVG
jgi:hemerythrin